MYIYVIIYNIFVYNTDNTDNEYLPYIFHRFTSTAKSNLSFNILALNCQRRTDNYSNKLLNAA